MTALDRLKEKIEILKQSYQSVQEENRTIKAELSNTSNNDSELEMLKEQIALKNREIERLTSNISEKDTEIEAIIAKVETLLA
ncbi:MAG: hypothetical protein HF962_04765 [Sulfurovum sp.]|nr:hypothetical protein [Sulfurovum sp.]